MDTVTPQHLLNEAHLAGATPLSVGVTVDLERGPHAGGHVKAWELLARAAAEFEGEVDLTLYVLGAGGAVEALAPNVRFVAVPPAFGTGRLPFVRTGAGQTDLARRNRAAEPLLARHDVLQATHAFALSTSAARIAARTGIPLIASIHTDFAAFAPVYLRATLERLFGRHAGSRALAAALGPGFARRLMGREAAILRGAAHVLGANAVDMARGAALAGEGRAGLLRRGIDRARFHSRRRCRAWFEVAWGVPGDALVLGFAGRIDDTKGVMVLAHAARRLRDRGLPVHVLAAGTGDRTSDMRTLLGDAVTLTGRVDQDAVARLMASSDLFVFPSRSEVIGNAVLEAMACGVAPVLADHHATAQNLAEPGHDGLLVAGDDPADWAAAIEALAGDPDRRAAMGRAARATVERRVPSWIDVLAEDLLPVWRGVAVRTAP